MFNWSKVHFTEVTSNKIPILVKNLANANSIAYALLKDFLIIVNFEVVQGWRFDNDQENFVLHII